MTKVKDSTEITPAYLYCPECLCERLAGPDRLIVNHNRYDADILDEVSDGVFIGSMVYCQGSLEPGLRAEDVTDEYANAMRSKVA